MLKHGYFTSVFGKSKRFEAQSATKKRIFASGAKKNEKNAVPRLQPRAGGAIVVSGTIKPVLIYKTKFYRSKIKSKESKVEKIIRVGIAGFGRSGFGIHANCLKHMTDRFKIVAVADQLPERRKDAEELGAKTYNDFHDLLDNEEIDLFVNATPSRFHVEASLYALSKKRNLLSEKPSALCVADFDRIVKAAKEAGVMFYPFQNSRFYPFFAKMLEVIESGVLGKIVFIRSNWSGFGRRWDWQTLQSECGGNLFNTGPHPVDQAVVLFGEGEYPKVFARMQAEHDGLGGDAENFVTVRLYGENKPDIEVVISSLQAYPQGEMYNISGTHGGLTGGPGGLKWKYFLPEEAPKHEFWKPWSFNRQYCGEQLSWIEESWSYTDNNSNATGFSQLVGKLYTNLYDVLVNGAEPIIKHDQVRRQVYIMEEAHKQNPLPRNK